MALNKKAQQIFLSIMMAIIILIIALIFSPVVREEVTKSINGSGSGNLSTSYADISVPNKATTIILDMGIFYFISIIIAASLAFVTGKKSITGTITAIMVFVVVALLITPLKDLIILLRDSSHLACDAAGVTIGTKLACIAVDIWLFYFAVAAISVAISYIFVTKALPKIKGE